MANLTIITDQGPISGDYREHKSVAGLPIRQRFVAAVEWARIQLEAEIGPVDLQRVADKMAGMEKLYAFETRAVIKALRADHRTPKKKARKQKGRPKTPRGRDDTLRRLLNEISKEFQLPLTSSGVSAAEALSSASRGFSKRVARQIPNTRETYKQMNSRLKRRDRQRLTSLSPAQRYAIFNPGLSVEYLEFLLSAASSAGHE